MTTRADVSDFIAQKKLAVVGVSRNGKGFGNIALKELKGKGYSVYPVNPNARMIEGDTCYPSLRSLPAQPDGVVVVVPPDETEQVVREAFAAGIHRIWIQQGAESDQAIRFCKEHKMRVVHGECILMFAEPAHWFHRTHRFIKGLVGKLPR